MTHIALLANDTRFCLLALDKESRMDNGDEAFPLITTFQAKTDIASVPHTIKVASLLNHDIYDGILEGRITTLTISAGVDETFTIAVDSSIGRPTLWLMNGFDVYLPMDRTPLIDLLNDIQKHWLTR